MSSLMLKQEKIRKKGKRKRYLNGMWAVCVCVCLCVCMCVCVCVCVYSLGCISN